MVPEPGLNQVFWPPTPAKPSALPVQPREYHEFYRAPRFRWWKPIAALAMFGAGWFLASMLFTFAGLAYDILTGRTAPADYAIGAIPMTPALFTANNLAIASAIPLATLSGWAVFGQRPRWLTSITGGFRWGLFWRFAAVAVGIDLVIWGLGLLTDGWPDLRWNADSAFMIAAIVLTTPFQAAGEEYSVRGLVARSVGSWFGSRRVGLVVATVVGSVLFATLHGADNLWLNAYYLSVGVACSVLVWKTGGLEAAIALHVFNNLFGELTLPFTGLEEMFNRGPGDAGPEVLLQIAFTFAIMGGMLWVAKRARLVTATAPARLPSF